MNFRYYFGFTKGQHKGLVLLLLINLGVIVFYIASNYFYKAKPPHDFSELLVYLDSVESSNTVHLNDSIYQFDPNAIGASIFIKFGLDKSTSERIVNYRTKGGRFRQSSDLLKIYGMDSAWVNKVKPFVKIEKEKTVSTHKKKALKPFVFDPNTVSLKDLLKMGLSQRISESWIKYLDNGGGFENCNELKKLYLLSSEDLLVLQPYCEMEELFEESFQRIDINSSDSIGLLQIKGVGPAFAHRIIEYREMLGGFVFLEQLNEIYGIDSLKYDQLEPQILIDEYSIHKLQINTDEFKKLLRHPYLSYEQVKSIVNYRNELGELKDMSELLYLEGFEVKDTIRLNPYISFKIN
jgi:DNA uptake protein ComE-like DNA-binding protein